MVSYVQGIGTLQKNRIVIVGFGGSGSHIIDNMIQTQSTDVEFITIDADIDYENIKNIIEGTDIVIITGGLGGQIGYKVVPEIAKFAKQAGVLTILIATKPFSFEGEKRYILAQKTLAKLKDVLDCIVAVPNDKILSIIEPNKSIRETFKIIDSVITNIIKGIIGTLPSNNVNDINIDIADLQSIMFYSGIAFAGIGESQGEEAQSEAMMKAIEFAKNDYMLIANASRVIVHFTMHPEFHNIKLKKAMNIINNVNCSADIIFGTTTDKTLPIDFIRVIFIITCVEKYLLPANNM